MESKYSKGYRFVRTDLGRREEWELIEWVNVGISWRWRARLTCFGMSTECWTDDYWIDLGISLM